ncbi:MAG: MmcQ/YjbR family DNA-binding protein [Acidobacteriaceae bacterium]|jgi:predicted DNA-binding protein (MmcQ/YjbR family)
MDAERLRAYLLTLPHVAETMQWGANLVFWVGDKAIGGKMFALIDLDEPAPPSRAANQQPATENRQLLLSYSAGPERYAELLERDGLVPAPYMARIHWVAAERWDVFSDAEWQRELRAAYDITLAKLPKKVRATFALPAAQQRRLVAEARRKLAKKS